MDDHDFENAGDTHEGIGVLDENCHIGGEVADICCSSTPIFPPQAQ